MTGSGLSVNVEAMYKILVIEDDETVRDVLRSFLNKKGFEVTIAQKGEAGLEELRVERFDIILTDLVMPGISGMDVLKEVTGSGVDVPVIVMTAFGTVENAVEAMKSGAFDYITKPFNLEELRIVLEKAISVSNLRRENAMLKMQLKKRYNAEGLIGNSPRMRAVYEMIEKIADTDSTVLITGESGTGKELVARTIHYNNSMRSGGPFIPLNYSAIPKDLLEAELFGHEKGAFTGAIGTRVGRFELAHRGTLFLDEIGELDPSLQVKLLRVLQEREFERVGGIKTIKVDVRILAATNKDLEKATKEGAFREDLYYRLNVIPLHLPPLRERVEDIPLLTACFIQELRRKRNRKPFSFSREAMDCLLRYRWPGNVRELQNLIERLTILVQGKIAQAEDLPERFRETSSTRLNQPAVSGSHASDLSRSTAPLQLELGEGVSLNDVIGGVERNLILQALDRAGGVRSKAAQFLSLNRTTLIEKMKKMGISMQKR